MNTILAEIPAAPAVIPTEADRFALGWRYVKRTLPDGSETLKQVPLTPKDVLHPLEEDFIVQDTIHDGDCDYLSDVLKARHAPDEHALVLHDCRIDLDIPPVEPLGPDISLILGVRERPKLRMGTFYVAVEGVRPKMLIEVISKETRANDLGIKVDYYHRARVPSYIIVDRPDPKSDDVLLIGYRYAPAAYERVQLDERGRLWVEPVGMWLGVENGRPVWYDGVTGEKQLDYTAESQARRQAEREVRAAEEAARLAKEREQAAEAVARLAREELQAVQERLRQLETELRRLRGEE